MLDREPTRRERRLSIVTGRATVVPALVVLGMVAVSAPGAPALAQERGVSVEAVAGIGGYVDATRPVEVEVTVAADLLFTGAVEVRQGSAQVAVPAEVPAGTTKVYRIVMPPPVGNTRARVLLVPESADDPIATANVSMRTPEGEILVGVMGDPDLVSVLAAVRTEIGDLPVVPVMVEDPDRDLSPLAYLVSRDGSLPDSVTGWLASGGRLILSVEGVETLSADLLPLGTFPRTGADWYRAGRGEVLGLSEMGPDAPWPVLVRPVTVEPGANDFWQTPERALGVAAAGGGEQRIPSLPWLLAAIVGYAVLVGPVNFLVLRRLRHRDLAWITVPLISVAALAGFWAGGQNRLQGLGLSHATILMGGAIEPTGRSALVLASGTAGTHRIEFDRSWLVYPGQVGDAVDQFGQPIATATGEVEGSSIVFDLPQLGAAAAQMIHRPSGLPTVALAGDVTNPAVVVDNPTDMEFWAWGVGGVGEMRVAPGALAPNGEATLTLGDRRRMGPEMGGNIGDAVVQTRQLWNDQSSWQVLYPLGEAAGFLSTDFTVPYFFGYTRDYRLDVSIDGVPREVSGATLVVVPLDASNGALAGLGSVRGTLVAAGDLGFLDRGPGWLFVSTDEMTVTFELPEGVSARPAVDFVEGFGERPRGFEAWDWTDGEFTSIDEGEPLDEQFVAASGEVLVKALARGAGADQGGFVEAPMSPSSLQLVWESA